MVGQYILDINEPSLGIKFKVDINYMSCNKKFYTNIFA